MTKSLLSYLRCRNHWQQLIKLSFQLVSY